MNVVRIVSQRINALGAALDQIVLIGFGCLAVQFESASAASTAWM